MRCNWRATRPRPMISNTISLKVVVVVLVNVLVVVVVLG